MTAYAIGSAQEHLAVRLELLDAEQDLAPQRRLKCCTPLSLERSPALTRDDLHRAAARWHTVRLAHRAAHEPRAAATPTAIQRSASESAAWTSCAPAAGMTPTETAQDSPMAMPIRRRRPLGTASRNRSGIEIVMSP